MRNVDPDEFSYIVLIKDMKRCVAEENEAVQLNLNEKFRVESILPLSGQKFLIDSDEDVTFLFQQYGSKGLKDIRLYVEALPIQHVETLQPLPEPTHTKPNDTQTEPPEEYCDDDFHWSDASNDDENSNGFAGAAGNDDGEAGDNDGGDGREEKAETSNNKGEVRAETGGHLSDYEKNSDDFMGGSSEDYLQLAKSVPKRVNVEEELYGIGGNSFMDRF
ncbi:hypothetical protein Pint_27786 [Pistacia integerrima]|uniref:Uncharacterized protein n=1 Tax=Pistacia integerrima TaxID=434235 RepID=A0ACC0YTR2_9ROSI|nr:hypothetical protein Pint_27786 [Pistacia integerrima]